MDVVYRTSCFLQSVTLRAFADWQVSGRENVPPMGPLIVVSNHLSNFDPSLLATSVPRRLQFLAKKDLFKWPGSWFLRAYGAFPLDREGTNVAAYRWALGRLEQDRAMVLFPEGTRSRGRMRKARPGVARLALKSQAPLLPVGLTGSERLGSITRAFNPTGNIKVNIGTVFSIPSIEGNVERELLSSIADMIMGRIAALLPPSYRGAYAVGERDHATVPEGG